jgi:hypothetical protein
VLLLNTLLLLAWLLVIALELLLLLLTWLLVILLELLTELETIMLLLLDELELLASPLNTHMSTQLAHP